MKDNIVFNYSLLALPLLLLLIGLFWIIRFTITSELVFFIFLPTLAVFLFKLPYLLLKLSGNDSNSLRTAGNILIFVSILLIPYTAYHLVKSFAWELSDTAMLGIFSTTFYINAVIFAFAVEEFRHIDVVNTFFTTWGVFSEVGSLKGILFFSIASILLGVIGWGLALF